MKKRYERITLAICIFALLLSGCGGQSAQQPACGGVLMEKSGAAWTRIIEKHCGGLTDLGKPKGTAKEDWKLEKGTYTVIFEIDEEMTQELVDGYAQNLWRTCEKASAESNQSANGYCYSSMEEAMKRQEPLNYYIWYYEVGKDRYRLGLYSTNMEYGIPGGLVLKIQPWNRKKNHSVN